MKKARSGKELVGLLDIAKHLSDDMLVKVIKKLSFDGFKNLVQITPWKTGRARSAWQVSVNGAPNEVLYGGQKGVLYTSAPYVAPKVKVGDIVHLYNNVFYTKFLEQGSSKQARAGMVEPTHLKITLQAEKLLKLLTYKKIDI